MGPKLLLQWPLYAFGGAVLFIVVAADYYFHAKWAARYLADFNKQDDPGPYYCS